MKFLALLATLHSLEGVYSFTSSVISFHTRSTSDPSLLKSSAIDNGINEDLAQWELFRKHHAKGSWKGIWTTYDYIGDVIDETVASVNYYSEGDTVEQTHSIVSGAKRSDCPTCFDSMEQKEFLVKVYNRSDDSQPVFSKTRFAANAMVNGPTLLRSGIMATELVLSWRDGRVRVTFQHAPVWAAGVEPESAPPQGLKLVRTMVSREALRSTAPTAETEAAKPPTEGNPIFYRPVPPFNWHKKWGGSSWTWGPNSGDRGWAIETLEEEDSWQGISTVERWNLRLPGGIFMQAPRVITDMNAELMRLAWLPDDETMLRVEAGCLALQPMVVNEDELVGFYPPSLTSLRCDVLKKIGELDSVPSFVKDEADSDELVRPQADKVAPSVEEKDVPLAAEQVQTAAVSQVAIQKEDSDNSDTGPQAARDALSL